MGTSSNQRSPDTPPWRLGRAVVGSLAWNPDRQSAEIWRAAMGDREGRLVEELSTPLAARACELAARNTAPRDALNAFDRSSAEAGVTGLVVEMARRAVVRACAAGSWPQGFGAELFAEAASYYAARDLPSVVTRPGHVETTTQSIALKDRLRAIAREASGQVPVRADPEGWRDYVRGVLAVLRAENRPK